MTIQRPPRFRARPTSQVAAMVAMAALLGGCAVGPNYKAPPAASLSVPAHYTAPATEAATGDLSAWWTSFDDPLLTSLVAQATAGNLDIKMSEARLRQAREALIQSRATLFPALTGSGGVTRNDAFGRDSAFAGPGRTQLSLGLDATWQADLFGGNRRSVEAARASADAALFNLAAVRTAVAGEVAANYISARLAQARLAIARDTLRTQDDNLSIAGWRVQAGLAPATDQEQARAQRAQTSASIPLLETSFHNAVNRLSVLTGQAPGALEQAMSTDAPIPVGPDGIAVGVPADTLRQRPDVRAAERQLAAATAEIGVAKAQLFPALSLTGSLGTAAANVGSLGNIFTSNLFAGLTQTIFNGGRLQSQVRSARAAADEAFANYKSVVLSGLEDAENALQSVRSSKEREAALIEARDASQAAAILARSQYRSGLTDFLTLLQSEQSLLSARDALASAQADRATAIVQLYLAVGGGWRPDAAEMMVPAK
jgi:NodT family efflux transporter outer membrane factor (OMF) lipoprotein